MNGCRIRADRHGSRGIRTALRSTAQRPRRLRVHCRRGPRKTRQLTWRLRSRSPQRHVTGQCRNASPPWARSGSPANCAVPGTDWRLNEAARLGSAEAVIPAELRDSREQIMTVHAGMLVHSVTTVEQALAALALLPRLT